LLFGVFAVCALLIAAVGVYGVVSYTVAERKRELGIRLALGARPRDILQLVIGNGARLAVIGIVIGLAAALSLGRILSTMLFQVTPHDTLTLAAVSVLLAAVALVACWLPARKAARLDPAMTLVEG
jgi:ABC-type antimicrobial peptide transport system permease subunit